VIRCMFDAKSISQYTSPYPCDNIDIPRVIIMSVFIAISATDAAIALILADDTNRAHDCENDITRRIYDIIGHTASYMIYLDCYLYVNISK